MVPRDGRVLNGLRDEWRELFLDYRDRITRHVVFGGRGALVGVMTPGIDQRE